MKHWIQAARLRTLPLSVSGIIVGSMNALAYPTETVLTPTEIFSWKVFALAILTTLSLQVLSNFANDYGDGIKGTDNEDRIGPKRTLQRGVISPNQMKKAIVITTIITLFLAIFLIYYAFGKSNFGYSIIFLVLGLLAIGSAIRYTVGNSAYGYKGFGDLFVFIFFGLVSTIGVNFLYSKQLDFVLFLPATAIGMLSVAVLNLNNMRDESSDRKSNKYTIVVQIGEAKAKLYHYFLIISAMVLMLAFAILKDFNFDQYLFLIVYIPLIKHLKTVYNTTNPADLDPELKKIALSTFALAVLIGLGMIFFLSDIFVNNG